MKPNQKADAADFMAKWLAQNIAAHPVPQDLVTVVRALTHNCLNAAALAGISAAEIELSTGLLAADHIQKAIDREISRSRRVPGEPPRKSQLGKPGAQQPPVTVIARQPEPAPYRLPARGHH
jgi:hypothetical protein